MSRIGMMKMYCLTPRAALGLAAALIVSAPAYANQVYKHTTPDGRVVYTDAKPKGVTNYEIVDVPKPPTEAEKAQAQKRALEEAKKRDEIRNRMDAKRKEYDDANDKVTAARKAVEDAEKALEEGRAPKLNEQQPLGGTGTRLSEDYFRRVGELEAKVEAAKKDLDEAQRQRNVAR